MLPATTKAFIQRWLITTVAVLVAAHVVKGISYENLVSLLVASLLLGILNAILRPIILLLSLPILMLTFGLFILVINAVLLYFVGWLVKPFHVDSFWAAFWGGLVISLISLAANILLGTGRWPEENRVPRRPPRDHRDGGGPVIDV